LFPAATRDHKHARIPDCVSPPPKSNRLRVATDATAFASRSPSAHPDYQLAHPPAKPADDLPALAPRRRVVVRRRKVHWGNASTAPTTPRALTKQPLVRRPVHAGCRSLTVASLRFPVR